MLVIKAWSFDISTFDWEMDSQSVPVLTEHHWEFPINKKITPTVTLTFPTYFAISYVYVDCCITAAAG